MLGRPAKLADRGRRARARQRNCLLSHELAEASSLHSTSTAMQPSVPAASHDVGDVEHDLELVKMWTSAARQAAGLWLREIHSARAAQRSVDDALAELRRLSVEIEKLEDLELSICVWEAILVVVHLRESLGGEVEPIVHAACELLAKRENALDRAIRSVQPVVIWDVRTAA